VQDLRQFARSAFLLALFGSVVACAVAPTEGYYDRDHHRYYHDHAWHDCGAHDGFCQ